MLKTKINQKEDDMNVMKKLVLLSVLSCGLLAFAHAGGSCGSCTIEGGSADKADTKTVEVKG